LSNAPPRLELNIFNRSVVGQLLFPRKGLHLAIIPPGNLPKKRSELLATLLSVS
jgi:hypothetical protein